MLFNVWGEPSPRDISIITGLAIQRLVYHRDNLKEANLDLLNISIDELMPDRFGFVVHAGDKQMTLRQWIQSLPTNYYSPANRFFVSAKWDRTSIWTCSKEEFHKEILPIYDGVPHAWPHHEELKANFLQMPEEKQLWNMNQVAEYFREFPPEQFTAFTKKHRSCLGIIHLELRPLIDAEGAVFSRFVQNDLVKKMKSGHEKLKCFKQEKLVSVVEHFADKIESAINTDWDLSYHDEFWFNCKLLGVDKDSATLAHYLLSCSGLAQSIDEFIAQDIEYGDNTDPALLSVLKQISTEIQSTIDKHW